MVSNPSEWQQASHEAVDAAVVDVGFAPCVEKALLEAAVDHLNHTFLQTHNMLNCLQDVKLILKLAVQHSKGKAPLMKISFKST